MIGHGLARQSARRWRRLAQAGAALACLALAACPRQEPPAPAEVHNVPGAGTIVLVQPGDTIASIARRTNVPVEALVSTNRLEAPYTLTPGQALAIPHLPRHTVSPGETLYGISRRYAVSLTELTRLNGIAEPYTIFPGQALVIPAQAIPQTVALAQPARAAPGPALATETPGTGTPATGTPAPAGRRPMALPERRPGTAAPAPPAPAETPPVPPAPPVANAGEPGAAPVPQRDGPAVRPPPLAEAAATATTTAFAWPVRGRLVSRFGPKPGGQHNDGINIAAPAGAPVKAAAAGEVIYTGNQLTSYGNLILVRHEGGWVTAYAHLAEMQVARGARVAAGQVIGSVGSTGSVRDPQLHFEIRKGRDALDPLPLLPAG